MGVCESDERDGGVGRGGGKGVGCGVWVWGGVWVGDVPRHRWRHVPSLP